MQLTQYLVRVWPGLFLLFIFLSGSVATAAPKTELISVNKANTFQEMFAQGTSDGYLRIDYDYTNNAYFVPNKNQRTVTAGGKLGFYTAELKGFSLGFSFFAQRGIDHSSNKQKVVRALQPDVSALGEAYIQWQDRRFRLRAGNQALHAPFTSSFNFRLIPELYQGIVARYGGADRYLKAMRIFRYKARTSNSFDRTTNYNDDFPPPNTRQKTDGFWAVGAADKVDTKSLNLKGQAWFFNYKDYANMVYVDGQIARTQGLFKPLVGLQFIREVDTGKAALGKIDHYTYGTRVGIKHGSLSATLNYDYIPHQKNTFLNGSLVTPYAHAVSAGPYFAQPLPNSTQDLGSGNAYTVQIKGTPTERSILGVRYSFLDLTKHVGEESQQISEFLIFGKYAFGGALEGLSIHENLDYQTSPFYEKNFLTSRFGIQYKF